MLVEQTMEIICSPAGVLDIRRPAQGIRDLAAAGFEHLSLDISMACHAGMFESLPRFAGKRALLEDLSSMGTIFRPLLRQCGENRMDISLARGAFPPRNSGRTDLRPTLLAVHKESIRLCGEAACRRIVIRPLSVSGTPEDAWANNRSFYLELGETAAAAGVTVLLENQCRDVNGHRIRGLCSDARTAAEWVDRLNREIGEERFGFCMDAGVCSLCGQDMRQFALELGSRLKAVVLRDCDGQRESSCLPFTCVYQRQRQTDWLSLIRGLREIEFDGVLLLDMEDTAAAFPPLLRPRLLALAKSAADYFQWQIEMEKQLRRWDSIVLFGAGNMCRNYMRCYGGKHPPLFACDNNPALWGTVFCGLEVKPPEALRDLPENCGLFICNVYYREIERQLREMGVQWAGYFSDEWMPSVEVGGLESV